MKQQTLAMAADQGAGFETHRKRTRRDEFLDTMNAIVPWAELCAVVEPHYPKRGNGRPPIGLERMMRIHFIQHWFNLADFACEEALYDSASLRRFAGIDLGCEAVPDATTLLKFRRLLETHKLGGRGTGGYRSWRRASQRQGEAGADEIRGETDAEYRRGQSGMAG
ncbi:transposase, partial [Paraburkholderia aspalathi]|uniref:transposase n=1 Tax=Paraburkholderia aspalathi TaxID=1324617 RepID=UPI003FD84788